MTREQMLEKLNISDEDFRSYLEKAAAFHATLNPKQHAFHFRAQTADLTPEEAAATFGPEATKEQIMALLANAKLTEEILAFTNGCC